MSKSDALSSGLPVYLKLAADDQDSVRLLTVEDLIVLARHLTPEEVEAHLLDQLRRSATDKSWRVRYMIASHFVEVASFTACFAIGTDVGIPQLAEVVGEDIVRTDMTDAFVQLLKDNEAEVRTAGS